MKQTSVACCSQVEELTIIMEGDEVLCWGCVVVVILPAVLTLLCWGCTVLRLYSVAAVLCCRCTVSTLYCVAAVLCYRCTVLPTQSSSATSLKWRLVIMACITTANSLQWRSFINLFIIIQRSCLRIHCYCTYSAVVPRLIVMGRYLQLSLICIRLYIII